MMKRFLGFAAAAVLALGVVPFAASGHEYHPVDGSGVAVGLETPGSQARTCAYAETPAGYQAVGVGAGVYYQSHDSTQYDAHNATESSDDGSICDADTSDDEPSDEPADS
jgi:hypothetical protein